MNSEQGSLEWAGSRQGRASEVCRRVTFLVLFTPQGLPRYWLVALGVFFCVVALSALDAFQLQQR